MFWEKANVTSSALTLIMISWIINHSLITLYGDRMDHPRSSRPLAFTPRTPANFARPSTTTSAPYVSPLSSTSATFSSPAPHVFVQPSQVAPPRPLKSVDRIRSPKRGKPGVRHGTPIRLLRYSPRKPRNTASRCCSA